MAERRVGREAASTPNDIAVPRPCRSSTGPKNNYSDAEYREHAVLGTVPVIAGTPVLFDHFIDDAENKGTSNDTTSIYAVTLGKDVGLCGLYPRADEGQPIQVRGPVVKESTGTMWYHVSWNVGLAAYDQCAVAQLNGVRHAQ